jgi:hypothetical protein
MERVILGMEKMIPEMKRIQGIMKMLDPRKEFLHFHLASFLLQQQSQLNDSIQIAVPIMTLAAAAAAPSEDNRGDEEDGGGNGDDPRDGDDGECPADEDE